MSRHTGGPHCNTTSDETGVHGRRDTGSRCGRATREEEWWWAECAGECAGKGGRGARGRRSEETAAERTTDSARIQEASEEQGRGYGSVKSRCAGRAVAADTVDSGLAPRRTHSTPVPRSHRMPCASLSGLFQNRAGSRIVLRHIRTNNLRAN